MKQLFPSKLCKLLVLILSLALIAGCSGSSEPTDEKTLYTVSVDSLDVHKKASDGSRILGQLPLDMEIQVLEEKTVKQTLWGRIEDVELTDGKTIKEGWIDMQYVQIPVEEEPEVTEPAEEAPEEPKTVAATMGTVITGKLNVRKGPDSKYETAGTYTEGDRIEILETKTEDGTLWGRTNLGWVGMGYVRMDGDPSIAEDNSAAKIISDGNLGILGYGVVNLGELNVRIGPGEEYTKVGTVKQGIRYAYYQVSDNWVRIESGWVNTGYFYTEGTVTENAFSGEVKENDLNIRTGPDTSFQSIGTYQKGETVQILVKVGLWGYTEQGWVFLNYIEALAPTYSTGSGIVTRGMNIRKEPNAEAEIVGELVEGSAVTVTEVDGSWGKIDKGWIHLQFVKYD